MGGANTYDNFDTNSIVTSRTDETVSIGKYSLRKREVLLGAIAIAALVGVVILAIVLAVRASDSDSSSSFKMTVSDNGQAAGQKGGDGQTGGQSPVAYCQTASCLQLAAFHKASMNEKADPCTDFYSFACGNFPLAHKKTPVMPDYTDINEVITLNSHRLQYMLSHPVQNRKNSYELKIKDFMNSCTNSFAKMSVKGLPLIQKVIEPLGGWWVFDQSVLDTFSFQKSLEKVHIDFWLAAFFDISIRINQKDWNTHMVQILDGGLGLRYPNMYGNTPFNVLIHDYYMRYMSTLAKMLCIDNQTPINNTNIAQFAADALDVETHLAAILSQSPELSDPHHPDSLMSLEDLNTHMNGSFDWISYMKTLFNENPGKFTADTKISVTRLNYFEQLGKVLQHFQNDDPDGDRKLHNYMVWRLIQSYSKDLSWEYVHASRKLNYALYGEMDRSEGYGYCFTQAAGSFSDAMNSLFIQHYVQKEGKTVAINMLEEIKAIVLKKIKDLDWMAESNQKYAAEKITITPTDYFDNVLQVNKLHRHNFNVYAIKPATKTEWAYHVFDPTIEYYNPWAELIVTSAAIQNPLFAARGPKYYNYGGIGSKMAINLVNAFDELGAQYKADGSGFEYWWTKMTTDHFAKITKCAVDSQKDVVFPTAIYAQQIYTINATKFKDAWAPQLLADSTGVRLAYLAYKDVSKASKETLPPGFSKYSNEQMFFLSYAQSFCQNSPQINKFVRMRNNGLYPGKERVNLAMKQVPEFHRAFDCPAVSASPKPCLLFDNTN